ncbi:MAG: hypothetical protein AB7F31_01735 [Parachlamydiales bacterium]
MANPKKARKTKMHKPKKVKAQTAASWRREVREKYGKEPHARPTPQEHS